MEILINFYPVQSGGGQQVASSLLKILAEDRFGHNWKFLVGEKSELHRIANSFFLPSNIFPIPYSLINRFALPAFLSEKEIGNIDIIYNYAPTLPIPRVPQVVRSVYSNLYFPEIDFWNGYKGIGKAKKVLIDKYRLKRTLNADGLVFENKSMMDRAASMFHYPSDRMAFIAPSVSIFDNGVLDPSISYLKDIREFKILYLSSWHTNKNIHILPSVAAQLKARGIFVKFVLSLDGSQKEVDRVLVSQINDLDVRNYFELIGRVDSVYVHQVIGYCNMMILLSKLECFSSNIAEAFHFEKPLVIANEPWAKSICGNAALYVDRDNPESIATGIARIFHDACLREDLVGNGGVVLREFNSPYSKVKEQVSFLEYIYEKKNLPV